MTEIDWTQPSREADAWIAEHVMGLETFLSRADYYDKGMPHAAEFEVRVAYPAYYHPRWHLATVVSHYTRDIAAAWEVFVRLGPAWQLSQADAGGWADEYRWWCWLPEVYGITQDTTMAPTAPLAICHAAYAAMQGAPE